MFEKVREIVAQSKKNSELVSAFNKRMDEAKTIKEMEAIASEGFVPVVYKIENKILKDNARRMLFAEVIEKILGIWNSYKGKPYGDKTKEKIRNQIKEATGCWAYFHGNELSLSVAHDVDNALSMYFGYRDGDIYTRGGFIDDNNKIREVAVEDVTLNYCHEYEHNPHELAERIYEQKKALEVELVAYQQKLSDFNKMLPSTCEHMYINTPSWYNIA
ncbi:MAG: hypothetical protein IIZ78_27390 [Clostridiales bacterium]|nr:hypothetical protein [Clostridiales bacterium]